MILLRRKINKKPRIQQEKVYKLCEFVHLILYFCTPLRVFVHLIYNIICTFAIENERIRIKHRSIIDLYY